MGGILSQLITYLVLYLKGVFQFETVALAALVTFAFKVLLFRHRVLKVIIKKKWYSNYSDWLSLINLSDVSWELRRRCCHVFHFRRLTYTTSTMPAFFGQHSCNCNPDLLISLGMGNWPPHTKGKYITPCIWRLRLRLSKHFILSGFVQRGQWCVVLLWKSGL